MVLGREDYKESEFPDEYCKIEKHLKKKKDNIQEKTYSNSYKILLENVIRKITEDIVFC